MIARLNKDEVTVGISECAKEVTKSAKMVQKFPNNTNFVSTARSASGCRGDLTKCRVWGDQDQKAPPPVLPPHLWISLWTTRNKQLVEVSNPSTTSTRCFYECQKHCGIFSGIYELLFGVTGDMADLRKFKFGWVYRRSQPRRIEWNSAVVVCYRCEVSCPTNC
jgi:hypothetical protein